MLYRLAAMANDDASVERVLNLWFGSLDSRGWATQEQASRWWKKDSAFDERVRTACGDDYAAVTGGRAESWLGTSRGQLAYVIVLDQFSRNLMRGKPEMYAHDNRAQEVVLEGLELGIDRELLGHPRIFFYMPLMHAEDRALQDRCVALFSELSEELSLPDERAQAEIHLDYAKQHRDIVARFGRFPHRNDILGRPSSDEEKAFLQQPGSSF